MASDKDKLIALVEQLLPFARLYQEPEESPTANEDAMARALIIGKAEKAIRKTVQARGR
jgi:hypothetical protein